jgi:arylsulfatase
MKPLYRLFLLALLVCVLSACKQTSEVSFDGNDRAGSKQPNILIVLADDMGFSDLGVYGSEIQTPNLDRLAREGIQFMSFHVGAACSPTRTMLMTGVDNHKAGLGNMLEIIADNQRDQPGYEGHLSDKVVTVSTLLRDGGYHTYMVGKWHLGKNPANIPHGRGFERSFTLMESGADNWVNQSYGPMYKRVHYFEDDKEVELPTENYFSTDYYTDKMIQYIESNRASGKPFFGYLAYQAVHSPHQAPLEYVNKYNGVYDVGWDVTREKRLTRQKELGLFGPDVALAPNFNKASMYSVADWEGLSEDKRKFSARQMQVYAGMVDNMDHNVGHILAYLDKIGEADNTLIFFLSDNGPDATELQNMSNFKSWYQNNYKYAFKETMSEGYPELGQKGSFSAYGPGWAAATASPTSYWKTFSTEGGLRVPFIAYMPNQITAGQKSTVFGYVSDIVPTIIEAAGVELPRKNYKGKEIHLPSGKSMWPLLTGNSDTIHKASDTVGYELAGSSAIFQDNYKLVRNPAPKGTGQWELYDIQKDPAEANDLAARMPELVARLIGAYLEYEKNNNVIRVPADYNPALQLQKNAARNAH